MSHRHDSGLTRAQRSLIREAIVAQLAQLIVATKPEANAEGAPEDKFVVAVRALPQPVRLEGDSVDEHVLDALQGGSPAICVALGNRRFESSGSDGRQWLGELDVHVYAVSSHARGMVDGRLAGDTVADGDSTKDPGLEVLCEHIFERLAGWPLTAARADELRAVREEFLWVGDDFTVVEILFTTRVTTNVNPNRDRTVLVEVIETTHTDAAAGDPSDVVAETELNAP